MTRVALSIDVLELKWLKPVAAPEVLVPAIANGTRRATHRMPLKVMPWTPLL